MIRTIKSTNDQVYVGILDDAREEMVNWKLGMAQERVIRPAFEKTKSGWMQVESSSLPVHVNWTVAFDGRNLGHGKSQADSQRQFSLTPAHTILTAAAAIPTVGAPSQQFAGIMGNGPTKLRRPLIAVSQPNFRDPDGWKRTTLTNEVGAIVRKAFRRQYPHVDRCKDEQIVEHDWKFPDSALTFPVAYASNKTSFLVEASLNAGDCGWVDQPDDPESEP